MYKTSRSLGLISADISREKLFQIGFIFKAALIIFLMPISQQEWFIPFIASWIEKPLLLPWSGHLMSGGNPLSFPYGLIMFIVHLPTTFIGWTFDNLFDIQYFAGIGFRFSLLIADVFLLLLLLQVYEKYWKKILIYYWLSPIVIFVTYWHGVSDIIPVALFIFSLSNIKKGKYWLAGIVLAFSVAAKHSMIIGVPFIFLYLWSHNGINKEFQRFVVYFFCALLFVEIPFLFSESFRLMVINNREVEKIYWLFIEMNKDNLIFITPIAYSILLYSFWRIRKANFDLLMASMGVAFSVIIFMTPAPPGWYLWLVPIFTLHQCRYGFGGVALINIFSFLFVSYHLVHTSEVSPILFEMPILEWSYFSTSFFQSLHYSSLIGCGILIALQILREGIRENDYYQLSNKPLALGIAGDSGVGKSTFARSLAAVFGERSLVEVSGDDYHNWDRSSPMWKTLTHLDPKANRLFELVKDVRSLIGGEVIKARHYDHSSGRFLPKQSRKTKDVILVEGLHTLYPKQLLEELDVKFFIEMHDSLRLFFRTRRDTSERGHDTKKALTEIEKRRVDGEKYIKPQSKRADVVFKLLPINQELFDQDQIVESNIKLRVNIQNGIYYQELVRVLIGVCGLQVNLDSVDERGEVILEISGEVASEDVGLAINMLVPHIYELFDLNPNFSEGIFGIMQIVTSIEIDEALKRRKIS
jgi:uridine kinase